MASLDVVSEQLLCEARKVYKETNTLTDAVLSALQFVFQGPLEQALDLVDKRNITKITCPSGRAVYQVVGTSGTPYTCPHACDYCSCPAFRFSVLKKAEHPYCKHLLAVRLSEAMEVTQVQEVSDQEVSNMLKFMN